MNKNERIIRLVNSGYKCSIKQIGSIVNIKISLALCLGLGVTMAYAANSLIKFGKSSFYALADAFNEVIGNAEKTAKFLIDRAKKYSKQAKEWLVRNGKRAEEVAEFAMKYMNNTISEIGDWLMDQGYGLLATAKIIYSSADDALESLGLFVKNKANNIAEAMNIMYRATRQARNTL